MRLPFDIDSSPRQGCSNNIAKIRVSYRRVAEYQNGLDFLLLHLPVDIGNQDDDPLLASCREGYITVERGASDASVLRMVEENEKEGDQGGYGNIPKIQARRGAEALAVLR